MACSLTLKFAYQKGQGYFIVAKTGEIICRERLGGLLKFYRSAA
jgi:hypothetical protein